jgi:hypothetical protein
MPFIVGHGCALEASCGFVSLIPFVYFMASTVVSFVIVTIYRAVWRSICLYDFQQYRAPLVALVVLWLVCLPLDPKVAGSSPAKAMDF